MVIKGFRLNAKEPPALALARILRLTKSDAKALTKRFPAVVATGLPKPEAERLARSLRGAGAHVEVRAAKAAPAAAPPPASSEGPPAEPAAESTPGNVTLRPRAAAGSSVVPVQVRQAAPTAIGIPDFAAPATPARAAPTPPPAATTAIGIPELPLPVARADGSPWVAPEAGLEPLPELPPLPSELAPAPLASHAPAPPPTDWLDLPPADQPPPRAYHLGELVVAGEPPVVAADHQDHHPATLSPPARAASVAPTATPAAPARSVRSPPRSAARSGAPSEPAPAMPHVPAMPHMPAMPYVSAETLEGRVFDSGWDEPTVTPSLELDAEALRNPSMYVEVTGNRRPLLKSAPPPKKTRWAALPKRAKVALLILALLLTRWGLGCVLTEDENELSFDERAELHFVLGILPGPLRRSWAQLLREQVRDAERAPVTWPAGEGENVECFLVRPGRHQAEQLEALRETGVPIDVSLDVQLQLLRGIGRGEATPICLWLP